MLCAVRQDHLQRGNVGLRVRPDRIGAPRVQLLERVGGVACQHHVAPRVVDADHRDVAGGMARGLDSEDTPVVTERTAAWERTERAIVECEWLGGKPGRQRLTQDAPHQSREGGVGELQLDLVDPYRSAHMNQPVDMIAVVVGEHDLRNALQRQASCRHRCGKLLLARHLEASERDVPCRCRLAAVDEQQTPIVLDCPAEDGQRLGPWTGQEQVRLPTRALAGQQERALDTHRPSRQGVDSHY